MAIKTPVVITMSAGDFMKRSVPAALNRQASTLMVDYPKIETFLNRELAKVGDADIVIGVMPSELDPSNEVYHAVSTWADMHRGVDVMLGGAHPPVLGAFVLAVPDSRIVAVTDDPEGRHVAEVLVFYPKSHESGFLLAAQVNFALDAGAPMGMIIEKCRRHGEVGDLVAALLEALDGNQTAEDPGNDGAGGSSGGEGGGGGVVSSA